MLRQRAVSAAVLVPPLIVVLLLGGAWIVAVVIVATALAAVEVFRLLAVGRLPVGPGARDLLALGIVVDAAAPVQLEGSGLILVAIGVILTAVGAFAQADPREGLPTGSRRCSGRCTVAARLHRAARPRRPDRRPAPAGRLGGERGWICS